MSEGIRLTLAFFGFALVFLAATSLFFPEQVGEKISQLRKLRVSKESIDADFDSAEKNFREAAKDREGISEEGSLRAQLRAAAGNARIMWVDDNPENNRAVIELLVNLGHRVDVARSNGEAVKFFSLVAYDLIISDIARGRPGEQENYGLRLPERLKALGIGLPPLIYYVFEITDDVTEQGHPVVNRPGDLLRLINLALDLGAPEELFHHANKTDPFREQRPTGTTRS